VHGLAASFAAEIQWRFPAIVGARIANGIIESVWGGGYRQLRGRARPPPEEGGNTGVRSREAKAPPSQARRKERLARRRSRRGAVLSGEAAGEPKSADGRVEMNFRALRAARRSAAKARAQRPQTRAASHEGDRSGGASANGCAGSRPESWWKSLPASAREKIPTTWRQPPGSRSVRSPVATRLSRRRSPRLM